MKDFINSMFTRSKVGILLAYALLTVVMHAHNSSQNRHGRIVARPITASPFQGSAFITKPIGIIPKVREEQEFVNSVHWQTQDGNNTLDVEQIVSLYVKALRKHDNYDEDTCCNGAFSAAKVQFRVYCL